MKNIFVVMPFIIFLASCSHKTSSPKYPDVKWEKYKGNEESIKKYLDDNKDNLDIIEGIYSISAEHSQKFLLSTDSKKSNDFARVAIIKDNASFSAQFIEVIVRGEDLPKYAKTADFTRVQRSLTYLSKQFSPDGQFSNYSFEYNEDTGTLVGDKKNGDITSTLSYLKLYPVK